VGWLDICIAGSNDYGRLSASGAAIAAEEPNAPAPPPCADRPLIVQPNGRVVADPATPLEVLSVLCALGDVISADPVFCFQVNPDKVRRAVAVGLPDGGPYAYLAERSRLPMPSTVARLLADIEGRIVTGKIASVGGVIALPSAADAQALAHAKAARAVVAGVVGRHVILRVGVGFHSLLKALQKEGFRLDQIKAEDLCATGPAVERPANDDRKTGGDGEKPGDVAKRLQEAAASGEMVEIVYRPDKKSDETERLRVTIEEVTARFVFAFDEEAEPRRFVRSRIVGVAGGEARP
jgi:hypothetical protein